jgi:O-antigen/teichoic acid export membrane protein
MTYMARYLGPAGYGILTFSLAFTSIFSVFTDFNLQLLIAREVARDEKLVTKYMANVAVMKIVLSIITFIMMAVVINLLGYPWQTVQVVYILGLSVICMAFTQMFYAVFQAYQRLEFQSIGQLLNAVLMTVLVTIAVTLNLEIVAFGYLYVASALAVFIYCIIVWQLIISKTLAIAKYAILEIDWEFWKTTYRKTLPFGLSALFVMTFYWISTVLLSIMKGDEAVGLYNAPYRMVLVLSFIPTALIGALYPVMSKYFITSQEKLRMLYEKGVKYLFVLSIPIGAGTTLLSQQFVLLIFGNQYIESIGILQILIWSEVFIFISMPIANLFNTLNKQVIVTKITVLCLLLNIGLNLILIPEYGITGVAITTVATEGLSLVLSIIWLSKTGYAPSQKAIVDLIRVVIASLIMSIFIVCLYTLNLVVIILLSMLLYFAILYVLRGIDREDIELIKMTIFNRGK